MLRYSIVDVFTREPFSGNPVAVIHDASNISAKHMQLIAKEFGFSETTFILPPRNNESLARVRIFTPFDEIPFAGHPNIGTAYLAACADTAANGMLRKMTTFDELGGPVKVWPIQEDGVSVGAKVEAPQALQKIGNIEPDLVARCLGLSINEICTDQLEPCVATIGLPFAFVELSSLEALQRVATDIGAFREAAISAPPTVDGFAICAFFVANRTGSMMTIRSRVFSPLGHPAEDPATGSASGALAGLLSVASQGTVTDFKIEQGVEIGRRSEIRVTLSSPENRPTIDGHCVLVASGNLHGFT